MATVPTLTVGGTDQTDYIHRKTLVYKLHSLDFTLIDPADEPTLHDAVSVDTPAWSGRVSTIESYPMRTAGGDDHRWVKVTCTNKTTATTDTAPFDLSDSPNFTTTFPYKDFGYIQTLADQTDLASAEHRLTAIVYEEGLLPGMTIDVTNAAESLSAETFIITEMTVEWLKDDTPQYRIEASVEGVPPVTLGDLIDGQGCDCDPYVCSAEEDYYVTTQPLTSLSCIINASNPSGDRACNSDVDRTPAVGVYLYAAAVYKVRYSVFQGPLAWKLTAQMLSGTGTYFTFLAGGDNDEGLPPIPLSGWITGSVPFDDDYYVYLNDFPRTGRNGIDSEVYAEVVYVSGADPRFVDLEPCDPPHSGQLVLDGTFAGDGTTTAYTTAWPYGASTMTLDVNGLDWTALITESDPTAGEYTLSYPPPFAATVTPRYRGA